MRIGAVAGWTLVVVLPIMVALHLFFSPLLTGPFGIDDMEVRVAVPSFRIVVLTGIAMGLIVASRLLGSPVLRRAVLLAGLVATLLVGLSMRWLQRTAPEGGPSLFRERLAVLDTGRADRDFYPLCFRSTWFSLELYDAEGKHFTFWQIWPIKLSLDPARRVAWFELDPDADDGAEACRAEWRKFTERVWR